MSTDDRDPATAITEVVVRQVFSEVLRSGKLPSDAAIAVATQRLQHCRYRIARTEHMAADSTFQSIVETDKLVIESARVLLEHLPNFLRSERARQDRLLASERPERRAFGQKMQQQLVLYENLSAALAALRPEFTNRPVDFSPDLKWHEHATFFLVVFNEAMTSTNPGRFWAPSNTGPAARFVRLVIEKVHGVSPTLDAVAKHLQRERATMGTI